MNKLKPLLVFGVKVLAVLIVYKLSIQKIAQSNATIGGYLPNV